MSSVLYHTRMRGNMRIERIDDKTVKCFLSNEELEEYDIDYKDFLMRNDKAKQVVHDIIVQAAEQVGYKPPKFAFDMQIMMLPDHGLILTFSETDYTSAPSIQQVIDCLKKMRQALQDTKEHLGIANDEDTPDNTVMEIETGNSQPSSHKIISDKAVFIFDSIRQVMAYACVLPPNMRIHSSLYKYNDKFYLYIQKKSASYERYSHACVQALEFGTLYCTDEKLILPLQEHWECLIPEKALQKLKYE